MPLLPPNDSFESLPPAPPTVSKSSLTPIDEHASLPPAVSKSSRKEEKRKKEKKRRKKEQKKERKRKERIKERETKEKQKSSRNEKTDRRAKKAAEWLWALRNGGLDVSTKEVMKAVGFQDEELHKGSKERTNVDRRYDCIAKERCILVVLEDQETSTAGFISFLTSRQSIYYSPIHLRWITLRNVIRDAMVERVWAANYLIPGTRILLSAGMYRQRCFYVSMKGRPRNPGVQGILMATSQSNEDDWEELHKRLRRT